MLNLALLSGKKAGVYFLILFLTAIPVFNPGLRLDRLSAKIRLRAINPRMQMLTSGDSKYQNITIAKMGGQFSVLSDGRFLFSFPDEYNQEMFISLVMSQHPGPKKILLIGHQS